MKLRRLTDMHTPVEYAGREGLVFECEDESLAHRLVQFHYCERVGEDMPVDPEPESEIDLPRMTNEQREALKDQLRKEIYDEVAELEEPPEADLPAEVEDIIKGDDDGVYELPV